jgi:hypothetical protein
MWIKPENFAINLGQVVMVSDEDKSIVVSTGKHIPLSSYEYGLIKQAIEEQINEHNTKRSRAKDTPKPRSTRNKVSK